MHNFSEYISNIGGSLIKQSKSCTVWQIGACTIQFRDIGFDETSYIIPTTSQDYIVIWQDQWQLKKEIIISRIEAAIGISNKIHARQTQVVRLDKHIAQHFLETYHLQGSTSAYYKYGLVYQDEIVAVATFSKARVMYDGPVYYRSYELERIASKGNMVVVGGLSKLIKYFINQHNVVHIMTYVDAAWGEGGAFEKIGFTKYARMQPNVYYVNNQTFERIVQHVFVSKQIHTNTWSKILNLGSYKMVYDTRTMKIK
jgi:hypothetical protein